MRFVALFNPASGRGIARRRAEELARLGATRGHAIHLVTLGIKDPDWRAELATAAAADGSDVIVAVGGDGTVNAVINALPDPSAIPLTVLPTGTANLLARELKIPARPAALLRMIETGRVHPFDMFEINAGGESRRGLLVASAGFDARVIQIIHETRRGSLGFVGYIKPLWKAIRIYRHPKMHVAVDDQESVEAQLVVVGNVRRYAAFFEIADQARFDSGHLDVVAFPRISIGLIVKYAIAARRRKLSSMKSSAVHYLKGKRISIESADADSEPIPIEIDGEYLGTTPIDIQVHPAVARVLGPA